MKQHCILRTAGEEFGDMCVLHPIICFAMQDLQEQLALLLGQCLYLCQFDCIAISILGPSSRGEGKDWDGECPWER